MVRFVDRPYLTEKVTGKISSIKWKMACGIGMVGYHFITLSDNDKDIFDIYPAAVFKQKHFRKSDRIIIGVADSIDSARELTGNMIKEDETRYLFDKKIFESSELSYDDSGKLLSVTRYNPDGSIIDSIEYEY